MLTIQKSRNGRYVFFSSPIPPHAEMRRRTISIRNAIILAICFD